MSVLAVKGVLFDFDGVIVDSKEDVVAHWRAFAQWYGLDGDELVTRIHGIRHSDTIAAEISYLGLDEVAQATARFEQLECDDTGGTRKVRGAVELLQELPPERFAIVTSCTRPLLKARLTAVGLSMPTFAVTADQVTHGKPHPEGYLKAADLLRVEPHECLVFEDAPSGLRAGTAAGAKPVAVATTMPREALRAALPSNGLVVDDLAAVRVRSIRDDEIVLEIDA